MGRSIDTDPVVAPPNFIVPDDSSAVAEQVDPLEAGTDAEAVLVGDRERKKWQEPERLAHAHVDDYAVLPSAIG